MFTNLTCVYIVLFDSNEIDMLQGPMIPVESCLRMVPMAELGKGSVLPSVVQSNPKRGAKASG